MMVSWDSGTSDCGCDSRVAVGNYYGIHGCSQPMVGLEHLFLNTTNVN